MPDLEPVESEQAKRPRPNQHKPIPPRHQLEQWVIYYWHLGFSDAKIADHALDHFDREEYGLSGKSVQRLRGSLGLKGTIKEAASFETLDKLYHVIRPRFPTMGARKMVESIRQQYSIRVSEKLVNEYLRFVEPDAVKARKKGQFKRRRFFSTGVMEMWSIDQHDKWARFGLWWHICVDPFTGRLAWLRVWWCNRNPRLLIGYYLSAAREVGGIPLITVSDRGRENNGIANMHTVIRHRLDPSLDDTLQHRFCVDKDNIKAEASWSQVRKQWVPGFEDILDFGIHNGWYDSSDPLENLVFRCIWRMLPCSNRWWQRNASPLPLPMATDSDRKRAEFLAFTQHVQCWKTKKLVWRLASERPSDILRSIERRNHVRRSSAQRGNSGKSSRRHGRFLRTWDSSSAKKKAMKIWERHGGSVGKSTEDFHRAKHMFCVGLEDPCLTSLRSRNFKTTDVNWIYDCADADFLLPTEPYILDEFFDPARMFRLMGSTTEHEVETICLTSQEEASYMRNGTTQEGLSSNRQLPLKRPLSDQTNDSPSGSSKKMCIKVAAGQSSPNGSLAISAVSTSLVDSEVSLDHTLVDNDISLGSSIGKLPEKPNPLDFKPLIPSNNIVTVQQSSGSALEFHQETTFKPLNDWKRRHQNHEPEKTDKKAPNPLLGERRRLTSSGKPAKLPTFKFTPLGPVNSKDKSVHTTPKNVHATFWDSIRAQYTEDKPMLLSLDDLLKSRNPSTGAKLFTSNGSCEGLPFGLIKLPPERPYYKSSPPSYPTSL